MGFLCAKLFDIPQYEEERYCCSRVKYFIPSEEKEI